MPAPLHPDLDAQRYARHLALAEIGPAGQARLAAARVLVVGSGGLGSPAALYLAAAGIGTLGIVDFDTVDLSNLQRQVLFGTDDIGRPKVEAARDRLAALNPGIRIVAHETRVDAGNAAALFAGYDLILDGSDRLSTRYLVNDACVLGGKPLVSAAIHRFEGQAMTYVPGKGPCYRCLFPDAEKALVPSCAEAGVLGVLPGVMGSLQATEAVKLVLGIGEPLLGRFLVYDALALRFQEFRFARRHDCAACGDSPRITSLEPSTEPGMSQLEHWSPAQLAQVLESGEADRHVLVDVREPQEWAMGRIPGSLHIPLAQIPARFAEIPQDRLAVFICAAGMRSLAACRFAVQSGRDAVNLEGGLYAWSAEFGAPPSP
jgi:adenylyltransferase/sulfurtransferase